MLLYLFPGASVELAPPAGRRDARSAQNTAASPARPAQLVVGVSRAVQAGTTAAASQRPRQ